MFAIKKKISVVKGNNICCQEKIIVIKEYNWKLRKI